jgi:hypothetical protein
MTHEAAFSRLCALWEKMQTARNQQPIVDKANSLIYIYTSKNEVIPEHIWPLIDFFEQADTVLKSQTQQKEVTQ